MEKVTKLIGVGFSADSGEFLVRLETNAGPMELLFPGDLFKSAVACGEESEHQAALASPNRRKPGQPAVYSVRDATKIEVGPAESHGGPVILLRLTTYAPQNFGLTPEQAMQLERELPIARALLPTRGPVN